MTRKVVIKPFLLYALFISTFGFGQTAKEYYSAGIEKINRNDYYRAISNFSKAIKIWEIEALKKEKKVSQVLDDWDYESYTFCYFWNGELKQKINDHKGAISDLTKYIQLLNYDNDKRAYLLRGISKENLGDLTGACADWKMATALGLDKKNFEWLAEKCN